MDVLPLGLKVRGRKCLVVGGGEVAMRKLELLASAGAAATVVAVAASDPVQRLCAAQGWPLHRRPFVDEDMQGCMLAIAATGEDAVNRTVAASGERRGVFVNCVDDGGRSTALFPAIVDRAPVTVAISTAGASPTLARLLRERIEAALPDAAGKLAAYLGSRRQRIRERLPDPQARRRFWQRALDGDLGERVAREDIAGADAILEAALAAPAAAGLVSLVGAGPGDPDLLTVKALRCLQAADVVYHDRLVGAGVLSRCRRDARRVAIGRRGAAPDARRAAAGERQLTINRRLLADARQGLRVVRLKGGDPLLFGRAGEEIAALAAAGVPFEIVPGVTAALACAAVAGIPLTHRDWAQSVRFVTARRRDGAVNAEWPELARAGQTLVVYMGLEVLPTLCERLLAEGAAPTTPVAVVANGTLPGQRIVVGTLADIGGRTNAAGAGGPATTIIGRVAALAKLG